jgi:hypothetical protein
MNSNSVYSLPERGCCNLKTQSKAYRNSETNVYDNCNIIMVKTRQSEVGWQFVLEGVLVLVIRDNIEA